MDELLQYSTKFNSSVKFLARVYALKKKGTFEEEKAIRTNKRLAIIIAHEPIWIIEHCGPFFLKYADMIKNRDWNNLIKQEFADEKSRYKSSKDGVNHTYNDMDGKIEFIKRVFSACDDKEKEKMGDSVQTMLSAYCEYAIHVKNSISAE
jgi:hypothetical protein